MKLQLFTMICGIFLLAQQFGMADSQNVCLLPKVVGPCKALFPRYYYNMETQMCEKFAYGGCRGNGNNFETMEECVLQCQGG
ncbi:tauPI-stichotoxin-Hcr2d-like [Heterodontus francisci]|uniref:tauPI-stichotoxin-Hcr2d-like n=1 Tax=Heterodontus francisci TaxID=7792 RepID=UPI00355AF666